MVVFKEIIVMLLNIYPYYRNCKKPLDLHKYFLTIQSGQSVMVDVATGGGSNTGEMVSAVFSLSLSILNNPLIKKLNEDFKSLDDTM